MTDKGAHPGVKSLLARFENSQPSAASPPPRDRSPASSDSLSKVRASFVAVDGGSQGGPALGLRRISPHSDSLPSPSRAKSFESEDLDGSIKSNGSSAQPTNGFGSPQQVNATEKQDTIPATVEPKGKEKADEVTSENKENQPTPKSGTVVPEASTAKPAKTVSKKPSNVNAGKIASTNKPASQAPISKTSATSRTATSATKPDTEKTPATRTIRTSRPSTTAVSGKSNEAKAPVHKTSRTSLATTNKTSTRPTRASPPAREATKPAARSSDVRSSSAARPARVANSTGSSQTSAAKSGATSTLSRKPSSLKSTTRQRAITPTASSVRKQAASRSPPGQSPNDRPHSRSSTASKPVDESFLARMMRPTASSASKTHEKVEIKSPPRSNVTRSPRKVSSKSDTRSPPATKQTAVPKTPSEPEHRPASESVETQQKEQNAKPVQEAAEQATTEIPAQAPSKSPEPVIEAKPHEEAPADAPVEPSVEPSVGPAAEPSTEPPTEPAAEPSGSKANKKSEATPAAQPEQTAEKAVPEPTEPTKPEISQKVDENAEPTTVPAYPITEIPEKKVLAPAAEIVEKPTEPADVNGPDASRTAEPTESEVPAVSQDKELAATNEAPLEPETKPAEVDIDLSKLTLNDKDTSN